MPPRRRPHRDRIEHRRALYLDLALTRKNALFADRGAEGWAMIASLLETYKLNSVDPLAWTTDVLTKLVNRWPASCMTS